jgi:phosphoglycerol transferase
MPLVILFGSWKVTEEVRGRQVADIYDEAGQFAKRYLGSATSNLAVIAPNPAGYLRTLFHIDNLKTQVIQLETGSSIDTSTLPLGINWLLLIGEYNVLGAEDRRLSLGKFSLIPTTKNYQIDFKQGSWPGVISRVKGLSHSENWGTWSIGREVCLELSSALPKEFKLTLDAHAFNPSANEEFIIIIGLEKHSFYLKTEAQSLSFEFSLPTNEREIRILIPNPTSPKSIGSSADSREIGIGLRNILITAVN